MANQAAQELYTEKNYANAVILLIKQFGQRITRAGNHEVKP